MKATEKVLFGSKVLKITVENLGGFMSGLSTSEHNINMSMADAKKNGVLRQVKTYYSGNGTKYAQLIANKF